MKSLVAVLFVLGLVSGCGPVFDEGYIVEGEPVVLDVTPTRLPAGESSALVLTGEYLSSIEAVHIGGAPARLSARAELDALEVLVPAHRAGPASLEITVAGRRRPVPAHIAFFATEIEFGGAPVREGTSAGPFAALSAGDVDADGRVDLIRTDCAVDTGAASSVQLVLEGSDLVSRPMSLPGDCGPPFFVGDLNGDGRADAVSSLGLHLGQGALAFGPSLYPEPGGRQVYDAQVADFSGDGLKNEVALFLGDVDGRERISVVGLSPVGQPVTYGTYDVPRIGVPPAWAPDLIAAGDLDGDGFADVLYWPDTTRGEAMILYGPDLSRTETRALPAVPNGFELRDLNGDGALDLFAFDAPSALQLDVGSLAPPPPIRMSSLCPSDVPRRAPVEGHPDSQLGPRIFVSCGDEIRVFLAALDVMEVQPSEEFVAAPEPDRTRVELMLTAVPVRARSLAVVDMDGDGAADLATPTGDEGRTELRFGGLPHHAFVATRGTDLEDCSSRRCEDIPVGVRTVAPSGVPDVSLVAGYAEHVRVVRPGTPVETWPAIDLAISGWLDGLSACDLDGDGDEEIIASVFEPERSAQSRHILLDVTSAGLTRLGELVTPVGRAQTADFAGDGSCHLLLFGDDDRQSSIWPVDLAGSPSYLPMRAPSTPWTGVSILDIDADGHLDLVGVEAVDSFGAAFGAALWFGDGHGNFERTWLYPSAETSPETAEHVYVASDFRVFAHAAGGKPRFVLVSSGVSAGRATVLSGVLLDRSTLRVDHVVPVDFSGYDAQLRFGELNGDGLMDVVLVPNGHVGLEMGAEAFSVLVGHPEGSTRR